MTRMLVTRPEPDASETARRLAALGVDPVVFPLLTKTTLPTSLPPPAGFAAIALTSANALRALEARGAIPAYMGLRVYAVGERTADAAREAGFADVVTGGGTLSHLIELIAHAGLDGPVLYPAATHQSGDLARSLAPYGVMVVSARIYEMSAVTQWPGDLVDELAGGAIGAALFYSRRTAQTFAQGADLYGLTREARKRLGALCLSETVAEPLMQAHFVRVGLADFPSEDAMMGLCLSFAREQNTP